jgi:hypothetical protein
MRKIRRAAATAIVAALGAAYATELGRAIRGPYKQGTGRDFLTGAAVIGAVLAGKWAFRELEIDAAPDGPEPCEVCG